MHRSRAQEVGEWESTVFGLLFLAWRTYTSLLGCAVNVAERRQDCGLGELPTLSTSGKEQRRGIMQEVGTKYRSEDYSPTQPTMTFVS